MHTIIQRTARLLDTQVLAIAMLLCSQLLLQSCAETPTDNGTPRLPIINSISIARSEFNIVSALTTVNTDNIVQVAIEYAEDTVTFNKRTPFYELDGKENTIVIPVLGLKPRISYRMRAVGISANGNRTTSGAFEFSTFALPADLPDMSIKKENPSGEGYTLIGFAGSNGPINKDYLLMVDKTGAIVWFRPFEQPIGDFYKWGDSTYTVFTSLESATPHYYRVDRVGAVLEEFSATTTPVTGMHALRRSGEGYVLFGTETRQIDLSALGGQPNAQVRGDAVEYHKPGGGVFTWSPFDHFQVGDAADGIPLDGAEVDPWGATDIQLDTDGNLLVSFGNADEITKINATTGAIMWRLGGKNGQFQFMGDPLNGFSAQSNVTRLPNGNILVFDNGTRHTPHNSRAVEYSLNETAKTATMVWEHRGSLTQSSTEFGSAQRLANGNTLICFGTGKYIREVDQASSVVWELQVDEPGSYPSRAFRVESLY